MTSTRPQKHSGSSLDARGLDSRGRGWSIKGEWIYDEGVQVGTNYLDDREVLEYDRKMRQIRNVSEEVEVATRALRLRADSTVWEIGTGTGEMALGLAVHCSKVWASDVSPAMLEFARRKAAERGRENVVFGLGGFLQGFAPDQQVDGVISQLALHHLPDFWKMAALRRVADFLNPEGRLYLKDVVFPGDLEDYNEFLSLVIDRVRNSGVTNWQTRPSSTSVRSIQRLTGRWRKC